jgi:hypothetical protein
MSEVRSIKPLPGSLIYVSLLPEYPDCAALHACDLRRFAQSVSDLDQVSRSMHGVGAAPLPIERRLARYLTENPAARQELLAATACRLTAYMPPGDGRLNEMTQRSSFDEAVAMLPTSPVETLDLERLTQLARRVKGDPRLQLRRRGLRTVPDAQGASIVFPPAEAALARTAAVCAAYTACRGPADLRLSVWVLAALLNAHPCPDGNGRLSRLVFAGVLTRMGFTHAPVLALGPLKHASRGAFEIAVRRIGVQGRWQPLIDLLAVYADYLARHLPKVAASSGSDARVLEERSMTDRKQTSTTGERACVT